MQYLRVLSSSQRQKASNQYGISLIGQRLATEKILYILFNTEVKALQLWHQQVSNSQIHETLIDQLKHYAADSNFSIIDLLILQICEIVTSHCALPRECDFKSSPQALATLRYNYAELVLSSTGIFDTI